MKVTANLTASPHFFYKLILSCIYLFISFSAFAQLPVPAFTANTVSGCAPLQVDFTDQSTGATSWQWDLGNGSTSNQQNPSTIYSNPGTYTVTLTVTNASGSQTLTKTNYITINAQPVPDFTANQTAGCFPLRVQFFDATSPGTGSVVSWNWSFGNGVTSADQNPFYTYTVSGAYFVSLTVTNSAGCTKTIVKPAFITVSDGVKADFNVSPPLNCKPPETLNFQNLSTGPPTLSYQWNFGDGNTSTSPAPSHNYLTAGPFTVTLITSSTLGCIDTIVKTNVAQLNNIQTQINAPATACINELINFQNQSTPVPVSSVWTFGDATGSTQINPSKAYSATGTYNIKLINQYGSCADSATATITINPRPTARFTSTDSVSCKAPHTVNFQDQSVNAISWDWDFGDGGTSTIQSPSHIYNTLGNYTVRLIVRNSFGCTDTMIKTAFVKIEKPVFNPLIQPAEGCRLLNVQFTANTTAVDSIASWFWDFGNGTSAIRNPSNIFDSGSYNIKLKVVTVQGCIDSVVINNGVKVGTKPSAQFNAVPLTVCAFSPVQFSDLSTGKPDEWIWDFGDMNSSAAQNPTHIYQDTGIFTIRLIALNNKCRDTLTKTAYIKVLPPISKFKYAVNCAVSKRQVQFTDQSTVATSWLWNFGDGNTSTLQNPVHSYTALGTYTVTLTAFNGSCSHVSTQVITLVDAVPNFNASKTTACRKYETISFTNNSSNAASIVSYAWTFGDGGTSTLPNPDYTYNNSGTYTVTLTVTDINGCSNTFTRNNYIRINGPVAGFTVLNLQNCINTNINFTSTIIPDGINPVALVSWNMGDGNSFSSLSNPFVYKYITGGSYAVTQTVRDRSGCQDVFTVQPIEILNPKAKFTVDTPSCPGAILNFNNQTTGATGGAAFRWILSDGFTSPAVSISHAFTTVANYTAKLIVTEPIGCKDSVIQTIRIDRPKASFIVNDSISICQPFEAKFTGTSYFTNSSNWRFGDGNISTAASPNNFYIVPGQYRVKLTVTSPGGCVDSAFKTMKLGRDTGTLNYSPLTGCAPLSVNLQTRTDVPLNYTWDLGDGTIVTTTDSNRTHIYPAGFYVPKVIIRDRLGCFGIIEPADTVKAFGSNPDFGADKFVLCDSGFVQFSDSTTTRDVITSFLWNFGDGNTSSAINPLHKFKNPGLYTVTLTINTITGCTNRKIKTAYVKVVPTPKPAIIGAVSSCVPASFQLKGNWLNPDTSVVNWQWDIDGQVFNVQNPPPIIRNAADTVFAKLILTNSSGCKDSVNNIAIARPLPLVNAGNDTTICLGTFATLNPSGAPSYTWSPSIYLNCVNCPNPQASVADNIQYTVTGTSAFGCTNKDSVTVKVKKPFRITASKGDTLCVGDKYPMFANGAENYTWSPPVGLTSTTTATTIASPTTTTIYKVVGYDDLNCFRDSLFVPVVVYNYPVITGRDTSMSSGDTIRLNTAFSNDVLKITWLTSYNISCSNCSNPLVWPLKTTGYRVRAVNQGGCETAKTITVTVNCGKENVFIPNAFTPDGNNINDRFTILGKGLQSVLFMRIYNRWGNLVFEKIYFDPNNPSLGWNGKINGTDAPPGVYSYSAQVICGDGGIIPLQGTVMLIR
ncbi:MAG: PKD domain-containing protein [Chitinophagaceae bacterium]|nr:PKD domain-containing protein [Chitinophagaceae bacterium]